MFFISLQTTEGRNKSQAGEARDDAEEKPAEKKDSNGLRPESPSGDGRNRRKTRPLVPRVASISKRSSISRASVEVSLHSHGENLKF